MRWILDSPLNFRDDGKRECIFYLSFLSGSIRNLNYLRAKAFGFPPPRHPGDFRAVFSLPLNGSITLRSSPRQSLSRGPWCLKQKKRQKHGFPIKDFGNDGKYYKGALPPYKPPKEKNMKTKEKDQKEPGGKSLRHP